MGAHFRRNQDGARDRRATGVDGAGIGAIAGSPDCSCRRSSHAGAAVSPGESGYKLLASLPFGAGPEPATRPNGV